jgi:hypothetical protein
VRTFRRNVNTEVLPRGEVYCAQDSDTKPRGTRHPGEVLGAIKPQNLNNQVLRRFRGLTLGVPRKWPSPVGGKTTRGGGGSSPDPPEAWMLT